MGVTGKYLYCLTRRPEERAFGDVAPIGDGGGPVYAIPHDGLAMVVSDSPTTEYQCTRVNMLAHQRVLERVMGEFAILPVRFGTLANGPSSTEDIRRLLDKRAQEFTGLLSEVEGRAELGLKALWRDEKSIFEELLAQNDAIRRLRDSLVGKPPQATHYDRVRLGEMVKGALGQKRASEAAGLLAPLRQIAYRTVENQVVVDRMIANAAFLVDNDQQERFDRAVSSLDGELSNRVVLRYVGPVPPYNFVNITINWQEL